MCCLCTPDEEKLLINKVDNKKYKKHRNYNQLRLRPFMLFFYQHY